MTLNHLRASAYPLQMSGIFRSLMLGITLIAATSALLLLSDLRSRVKPADAEPAPAAPVRKMSVALLQHASIKNLDDGRDGVLAGLAEQGWREGENLEVRRYNAEGDMAVAQTIAKAMVGGRHDLLLTISTTSLQAVANANKAAKIRHVFGIVTDPYAAGVGINRDNHLDHPAHLAGYATMQPVELSFQTARRMNPALARVGVVWNAAETNSEAQVKLARKVCAGLGIELVEATVENSAAVGESAAALVARGVDAIWVGGDVTVITAIDTVIAAARKGRIPAFSVVPNNIKRGMLFDLGADYFEVGRITGVLAGEVLNGRDTATVSIDNRMPETLTLNLRAVLDLKDKWVVPDDLVPRAANYIDLQGVEHSKTPAKSTVATSSAPKPAPPARIPRVAIVQHNTQPIFDAGVQGMLDGLAEAGFRDGQNMAVRRFNPMSDANLANAIAVEVSQGVYDLILTVTTPSLQSVANANRSRRTPHLFALVADPSATGVGVSATDPLDHPSHLSGYGTRLPVISAFRIAREINPALKTVGVVWNSAEVNSEVQLADARKVCAELGITLVEVNADSTNAVAEATAVLLGREVEAVFIPGDITVLGAVNNVLQLSRRAGVPVFSLFPSAQPKGELFNVGADYHAVGVKTGLLAAEVLNGRAIATVPVKNFVPEKLAVNEQAVAALKNPGQWRIPAPLRDRAVIVVDAEGRVTDRTPAPAVSAPPAPAATQPLPPKTIAVAYYAPEPSWKDCYQGLLDELDKLGYAEGKNLTVRSANTQGEAANILPILQNYDSSDADAIVTFSTPMLQGALATLRNKPVVFTYVTDPLAAGAGKSWTDHHPRVTGVGTMIPVPETIATLRKVFPGLKRLGTLFNAGEVNSTRVVDLLRTACRDAGIELVEISVATTSDAVQAAQALASRQVEAVYLPNDNLVYQAFPGVMQTLERARLPVINGDPSYVGRGVFASVGPGYYAAGQAAARKLARVLAGEKPAGIPMENVSVHRVAFDRGVARKIGLSVDEAVLKSLESLSPSAPAPATAPVAPVAPAPTAVGKKFRIDVVTYIENPPMEETLAGLKEGLAKGPLLPGRDLDVRYRSAQGDMSTLSSLYDAALTERADMLVPLSTPSFQVAIGKTRSGRPPVIFGTVANPVAAGGGKSNEDHLPHVTGITVQGPAPKMVELLRRHFPQFKRIGTLYCPAEVNSVDARDYLVKSASARGITVEFVAVNSPTELVDAATSLASRDIDAIVQVSDNLSNAGFTAIARAARAARKPLLSMNSTTIPQGAGLAMGHDYHEVGLETANRVQRVLAGENPAAIPFAQPDRISLVVHPANALATGLVIPEALLKEAGKVIRD